MRRVVILGATGSIGTTCLNYLRNSNPGFLLVGATAKRSREKLESIGKEFNCPVLLTSPIETSSLSSFLLSTKPDIVLNAVSGADGLFASVTTIDCGIDLALSNKESVVMGGSWIFSYAEKKNVRIIPVDSEHSAIFTLINAFSVNNVSKLVITASGGPFRTWSSEKLKSATLKDALKHPTWNMGTKITVDSATLGNKGLEVIEAKKLFGFDTENIQVVVHPQSIVHSLIQTKDGIVYGQFSEPDMKHPIMQALDYPKVNYSFMKPFDLTEVIDNKRTLTFEKPRYKDFPLLSLAFMAAKKDAAYPIAFNAANEIAAWTFMKEKCTFSKISETVEKVLASDWSCSVRDLKDIFEADKKARKMAEGFIA